MQIIGCLADRGVAIKKKVKKKEVLEDTHAKRYIELNT